MNAPALAVASRDAHDTQAGYAGYEGIESSEAEALEPGARLELLRRSDGATLYRVLSDEPGAAPRLLAVCATGRWQALSQRRLEHGYALRDRLAPHFITVPLRLLRRDGLRAMLLTDPGGRPLEERLGAPLALAELLALGVGIARALGSLHARNIVHKDVRPDNLLVDGEDRVCLTGFGGASRVTRQQLQGDMALEMSDALPYMAPEQTGRMNRAVDTRSDLYSLGVTLYRMATGELPFQAVDALEWVHCHVAREAVPPSIRRPGLPRIVSDIVMRLMSKAVEERYQTAAGVEADLRRCESVLLWRGQVERFVLGTRDVPDRLLIAGNLYGRSRETQTLLEAYRRVADTGRTELVLISGPAGVGKSSLVGELRKALVARHGMFASGKFEQHKRDMPYATLAQALRGLVVGLLAQDAEAVRPWRARLLAALGANGQIVLDLVPELEHILGPQPALHRVSPAEASLRFQVTLQRFISVFARACSPLVLFLDDLQWLDAATLDWLQALFRPPGVAQLLLVGAYRDDEVDAAHPLAATLAGLRASGTPMCELPLQPLHVPDLEELVAHALHDQEGRSAVLAALIWQKTEGNPFFASQFLGELVEGELVWFDRPTLRWLWDLPGIRARNYSDNVADLMADKIARLPAEARRPLTLLACLGATATVAVLADIAGLPDAELRTRLGPAEEAGLVAHNGASYRFLHDRIQEAAYACIAPAERAAMHLAIGRRLRAAGPRELPAFALVNQFARAEALLDAAPERLDIAALYLAAAQRAMAETAYGAAQAYLASGERLLPPDAWGTAYRLAFDLARAAAECEFLLGEPRAADQRLSALAMRARGPLDTAGVTWMQVTVQVALDQSARAIATGLAFLRQGGIDWPQHPQHEDVEHEHALLHGQLDGRPIEALLELPAMADPLRRATLDVLAALLPPAFFSDENLVCLVLCRMAKLSLQYGNADASPLAYAYLGMVLGPRLHDYDTAFRFGKLGFDLVEQGVHTRYKARVYLCFAYHVMPWAREIRSSQCLLRRAFQASRDTGDITYAGFSSCCLVSSLLASGEPLDQVQREARAKLDFVSAARFGLIVDIITVQQRLVASLQGRTEVAGSLDGGGFSEDAFEQHLSGNRDLDIAACWYWVRKAQARFLGGRPGAALQALERAEPLLWSTKGHFEFAEFHFFGGLIRAACCDGASDSEGMAHRAALAAHRRWLDEWARHCPENFRCRAELLAAEAARVDGLPWQAMQHYEAAIAAAGAGGFAHIEALALEASAGFHQGQGLRAAALGLGRAACDAYGRWGADAKVRQLEKQFPGGLRDGSAGAADPRMGTVDVDTLLRTSRAVAAEKGLGPLIRTLMTIALEHAGAERGLLVLPEGEGLQIAARAFTAQHAVEVQLKRCEASSRELPLSVLHYAIRTQAHVLIDDARQAGPFARDAYLAGTQARSVLCVPLVRQGELIGLLYLENSLAAGVFTPERVALLGLLAFTAATSMENASLGEKESLLQEVHHRVKNNLQLISSLLNLQASRIEDPAVAELFADSRNRVRSMALVHENLYRAGNFARVPMADHLGKLCAQLARAYGSEDRRVALSCRIEDIQLGLSRAVSCGLIVNELVSNALKHAFPGGRPGQVCITLQTTAEGRHALTVSDNGVGLPTGLDVATADSLGLQLVDDLSAQLHGEVQAHRDAGTRFVVTFDADPDTAGAA